MSSQAVAFVVAIGLGVAMGVFFDLFRVLRRLARHKTVATAAQDVFFWLISTLLMFVLLTGLNQGEIRGYHFLGLILGAIVYLLTFSRHLVAFLLRISRAVGRYFKNKAVVAKKGLKSGGRYVMMRGSSFHDKIKRGRNAKRKSAGANQ